MLRILAVSALIVFALPANADHHHSLFGRHLYDTPRTVDEYDRQLRENQERQEQTRQLQELNRQLYQLRQQQMRQQMQRDYRPPFTVQERGR